MGSQRKRARKYDRKRDDKMNRHAKHARQVVEDEEVPINVEENTSQDKEDVGASNQNIFLAWNI